MVCGRRTLGFATIAVALAAARAPAAVHPDEVDAALARARDWLLTQPSFAQQGNWEAGTSPGDHTWGGRTALMTYALLASGLSPNDPRLKKPIDFLRTADITGYYALGLRAQIWSYLPHTPVNAAGVERDFRLLVKGLEKNTAKTDAGLFDYGLNDHERIDLSVSQYGVLGLWACARLNSDMGGSDARHNLNIWQLIDARWKALQHKDTGGWSYDGTRAATGSMTAAGVATLYITQDQLAPSLTVADTGNAASPEIDRGIEFLAAEYPRMLGGDYSWLHYTLYGIERIGVASGFKYLGGLDWYADGAAFLCRTQSGGHWTGQWSDDVTTAFSILFLARGREPVMMNKIKYDQLAPAATQPSEGRWNQRGRDVASAARFVGRQVERTFNWQIIDLGLGTVRDLHDAPIAYLSFRLPQAPRLPAESVEKLRTYVEGGGMLLLNGDSPPRDREKLRLAATQAATRPSALEPPESVVRLFAELFSSATLRPLPADHPILRGQQFKGSNWQWPPVVYEVTNGARTLALYLADDPGRAWQIGETRKEREKFELIANIYQYAIDKEHAQVKGRTHVAEPLATLPEVTGRLRVARVRFAGNHDPEPGGWRRLQTLARNEGIEVAVESVEIERDGLDGFGIAHLTGAGPVRLSPAAVERLKAFVSGGGVLLVDAAGGDKTFAADVERVLGPIADAFSPIARSIPAADPIYADAERGPIPFGYRAFALSSIGQASTPRIRGTKFAGRWGVLYSPEDLTVGLVGHHVDGIRGYTPAAATEIVLRLVRSRS